MKTRIFEEHNYKAIHLNGKTLRLALDPSKPISELKHAEFFDIAITQFCKGNCKFCYQDSNDKNSHPKDIINKVKSFFGNLTDNEKPFQVAIGGGEPTSHPDFAEFLKTCYDMGITPNYTTNGMWTFDSKIKQKNILDATIKYCGGVAVSTHSHLEKYWKKAVNIYLKNNVFTNLHVIIGDKKSIDDFLNIYETYKGKIKYFVLLPLTAQGRAKTAFVDYDYLQKNIKGSPKDIAFGANFYPYLIKDKNRFNVSLYTPEIMSKYLNMETMKVYKSSFSNEEVSY
jgi:organic radical activating enzyme